MPRKPQRGASHRDHGAAPRGGPYRDEWTRMSRSQRRTSHISLGSFYPGLTRKVERNRHQHLRPPLVMTRVARSATDEQREQRPSGVTYPWVDSVV